MTDTNTAAILLSGANALVQMARVLAQCCPALV